MSSKSNSNYWLGLLEKIVKIILKNMGVRTSPKTHHQHVVPHEDGWAVKGEGNKRYTAIYPYQKDAIERAKEIAQNYEADVIIHGKDGRVRDRI